MAMAVGTTIGGMDGTQTKVVTITATDNIDATTTISPTWTGAGPGGYAHTLNLQSTPLSVTIQRTDSVDSAASQFAVTAMSTTGFTLRKLTQGGGANALTLRLTFRTIHSVDR